MYILFMVAIFYFLLIRPQQKKQKAAYAMQAALQKGDKLVTIGGVHAEVCAIEELTLIVKLHDGTKMRIDKGAVRNIVEAAQAPAPVVEA